MLQLVVNGAIAGGIYALAGIGLTLTYGILRFANFAHGDLMTLGAYLALLLVGLGLPLAPAFLLALPLGALAAIGVDRALYRPLRRRGSTVLLIASIGAALLLRNLVLLSWGPQMRYFREEIQIAWRLPGGVMLKPDQALILVVCAASIVLVHLFLTRSRPGKAMRAAADNLDLARVCGIDTERVVLWTWGIGGVLAAAAGILLGLEIQVRPVMGWELLLPVFAAVILGGIGRPYGAMAGGLLLGVAQEVSTAWIAPHYKGTVAFAILVAVLLLRPQGLLGRARRWS